MTLYMLNERQCLKIICHMFAASLMQPIYNVVCQTILTTDVSRKFYLLNLAFICISNLQFCYCGLFFQTLNTSDVFNIIQFPNILTTINKLYTGSALKKRRSFGFLCSLFFFLPQWNSVLVQLIYKLKKQTCSIFNNNSVIMSVRYTG